MTKQYPSSKVAPHLAAKYYAKAIGVRRDADKMLTLSGEFSGNGIAVLCVHAAIAFGDAVTVQAAGKKSKSGDHVLAADFLYASELIGELTATEMMERLDTFAVGYHDVSRAPDAH